MKAQVAKERFIGSVQILEYMVLDEWKDEVYRNAITAALKKAEEGLKKSKDVEDLQGSSAGWALDIWHAITQLLHRKDFFQLKAVPHGRI